LNTLRRCSSHGQVEVEVYARYREDFLSVFLSDDEFIQIFH
jgi:hypothetical protein